MSGLYALLILVCLITLLVAAIMAIWRTRRRKAKWLAGVAMAGLVVSVWQFGKALNDDARQAGFLDAAEKTAFQKSGATDLAAWRTQIADEKIHAEEATAKQRAAADAAAAMITAEKARSKEEAARKMAEAEAASRAVEVAAKEAEAAACKGDLQCWGDKHLFAATAACKPSVERLARLDFQWVDGILETKFAKFAWGNKTKGTLTYLGDAIQFQNGFGNVPGANFRAPLRGGQSDEGWQAWHMGGAFDGEAV
ncbi:MAG: hypothetical protein H6R00_3347, partial [Proteobacteria bacterium]|nr:hypothetical protein [Pseudomonadota bacterium]